MSFDQINNPFDSTFCQSVLLFFVSTIDYRLGQIVKDFSFNNRVINERIIAVVFGLDVNSPNEVSQRKLVLLSFNLILIKSLYKITILVEFILGSFFSVIDNQYNFNLFNFIPIKIFFILELFFRLFELFFFKKILINLKLLFALFG